MTIKVEQLFSVDFYCPESSETKQSVVKTIEICSFYIFFETASWSDAEHFKHKKMALEFVELYLKKYVKKGIFFDDHMFVQNPNRIRSYMKYWKYYKNKYPDEVFPEGEREEFEDVDESGEYFTYSGLIHLSNLFDPKYIRRVTFSNSALYYSEAIGIILFNENDPSEITNIMLRNIGNRWYDIENYTEKKSIELISKGCVLLEAFGGSHVTEKGIYQDGIAIHCPINFCDLFESARGEVDFRTISEYEPSVLGLEIGGYEKYKKWIADREESIKEIKEKYKSQEKKSKRKGI